MYVGLKQPRGDGERYVTPARAAAKETRIPLACSISGLIASGSESYCKQPKGIDDSGFVTLFMLDVPPVSERQDCLMSPKDRTCT